MNKYLIDHVTNNGASNMAGSESTTKNNIDT